MSELVNVSDNRKTMRWKLLTSASAFALIGYAASVNVARAADEDRPLIWIELGGQAELSTGQGQVFAPNFIAANPNSPVLGSVTPLQAQHWPKFTFGEDGRISFEPKGSDWIFSAAVRLGRASNVRRVEHITDNTFYKYNYTSGIIPNHGLDTKVDFADTKASHRESHAILDFTAGKDVGLGMFGRGTVSVGVRIAQFTSTASMDMRALPDRHLKYIPFTAYHVTFIAPYFHTYHSTGHASRDFRGVGPTISWAGSAPFVGNAQDGELALDWGANAAILFGKQKARVQHHESAHYYPLLHGFQGGSYPLVYDHPGGGHQTNHSVTVPNIGGSVGLSWRVQDFKLSLGYRADFFFGAMDTGIDAAKKSNLTFNGPYARISVGLGD